MSFLKCIFVLFLLILISFTSVAQNKSAIEKDFTQVAIFADQADYKGGYFYSKKILASINRNDAGNAIDLLRAYCYVAFFSDKLNKLPEVENCLKKIQSLLPALYDQAYTPNIANTFEVLCEFYYQRGIYTTPDSIYQVMMSHKILLLPYDTEVIDYYHNVALYNKGFLNTVGSTLDQTIVKLRGMLLYDSIHTFDGHIKYAALDANAKMLRQNLLAKNILLKGQVFLENGFSDSTILYIKDQILFIKQEMNNREGYKAQMYFLLGLAYLDLHEFELAENVLKTSSALSQRYFQPHSPVQIRIEMALITALKNQHKREEAEYYKNDVSVKLYSYFNKTELPYLVNSFTDIEEEIIHQNWKKAEEMLKTFLSHPSLPSVHCFRAKYQAQLFNVLVKQQKFDEADELMHEMLLLQSHLTGKDTPAYSILLLEKAAYFSFDLNKFIEAKTIFLQLLDGTLKTNISFAHPAYIKNSIAFADLYIYTEEFDLSAKRLEKNLAEVQSKADIHNPIYAIYLYQMGELKTLLGDFTSANEYLNKSIDIFSKNNKKKYTRDHILALEMSIKLHILLGDYQMADELLETTKKIAAQAKISEDDDIFLIEEIGLLYTKKGEYQKANRLLTNILKNKELSMGGNHKSICNTLNYLGEQNLIVGNYSEADSYFERSLQINKAAFGEKSIPYATSLLYYKQLYTAIGDYEKAESSIKEALDIYTKTYGDKNIKTGILMHEAALATFQTDVYTSRKNKTKHTDLEKQFLKALEIIKNTAGENSTLYAEGLEDYTIFLALTNQFTAALANIDRAKKIWETKSGKNNIHNAQLNNLSGKIFYRSGKYKEALAAFEKTRDEYKTIFDDNHPGYVFALGSCAQMYYILGNTSKAIESIEECTNKSLLYIDKVFPFLSERGKVAYWDKIKEDLEFYKTIAFTNSKTHPEMIEKIMNIQLQTKSILLNSQLKIKNKIYASGDTTAIRLYQDWQDLRDNLAIAYSMSVSQRKEDGVDIAVMEAKLESTEKELSAISQYFSEQRKSRTIYYTWKNVKQSLQENEIAIETIPFRYFTKSFSDTTWYAFISVTNTSSSPSFVIEENGKALETKYLKYYQNMIKFSQEDNTSYTQYWKPISTLLNPSITHIYFAADGVYNQINVETLKNEQGDCLINSTNIIYIGSCRDIINKNVLIPKISKNETIQKPEIDLIGNPTYYTKTNSGDYTLDQLPGSETEVKNINTLMAAQNWKTNVFIGNAATEDTVKNIKSPNVLHISTHGFFWSDNTGSANELYGQSITNPLLMSGVVLFNGGELLNTDNINAINKEDGILTAYEAMNLSLDKTELVVLSACETGLGEIKVGEGVYGLQRSFTVAGAKSIIMSLSKVSDEVTIKLMESFYTYWLQSGNKRDAFTKAKKELMKEYPDPKYWGAFIMIGL